jgi:hypothetical protein
MSGSARPRRSRFAKQLGVLASVVPLALAPASASWRYSSFTGKYPA